MAVKGRDAAAMKERDGLKAKLEATALGYLRVFRKTDERVPRSRGHERLGRTHPVTAGCGFWKEVDNGKGRKAVRRQEAQIAITPARRALPACN